MVYCGRDVKKSEDVEEDEVIDGGRVMMIVEDVDDCSLHYLV